MPLTADPYTIVDPSIMIDTVEFQCATNSITVSPVYVETDATTFCKPNNKLRTIVGCSVSIDLKQSYGTGGSFNLLHAMAGLVKTIVIKPADSAVAATNPSITFSTLIPQILPVGEMKIGEVQVITLDLESEAAPVIAIV